MAAIADKEDKLKAVLTLEAWSDLDQKNMAQHIIKNRGEIVTINNAKIMNKGRTVFL